MNVDPPRPVRSRAAVAFSLGVLLAGARAAAPPLPQAGGAIAELEREHADLQRHAAELRARLTQTERERALYAELAGELTRATAEIETAWRGDVPAPPAAVLDAHRARIDTERFRRSAARWREELSGLRALRAELGRARDEASAGGDAHDGPAAGDAAQRRAHALAVGHARGRVQNARAELDLLCERLIGALASLDDKAADVAAAGAVYVATLDRLAAGGPRPDERPTGPPWWLAAGLAALPLLAFWRFWRATRLRRPPPAPAVGAPPDPAPAAVAPRAPISAPGPAAGSVRAVAVPLLVPHGVRATPVRQHLLRAARRHPLVVADPEPACAFAGFAADGLCYELRLCARAADATEVAALADQLRTDLGAAPGGAAVRLGPPRTGAVS